MNNIPNKTNMTKKKKSKCCKAKIVEDRSVATGNVGEPYKYDKVCVKCNTKIHE